VTATDLTSGPAFESQVRSLLDRSHPGDLDTHESFSNYHHRAGILPQWSSVRDLVDNVVGVSFPSLEESQHLLDQFLFYLGVSQHFFDPRSFSDDLMLLFQSPETRKQQMQSSWFTEYLLVMAMAKLMDVRRPTSQTPGADLFAEALKRLPPLHRMGGEGVIAVEILTLIATYLQWCDRKHDAYLYVCLACPAFFYIILLTSSRLDLRCDLPLLLGAIYGKVTNAAYRPRVPTGYDFGGQYTCLIGESCQRIWSCQLDLRV
jgi:proline utilization trans-activator